MSMGVDLAGRFVQQSGTDLQFAGNLSSAWNRYVTAKAQAAMMNLDANVQRFRASEYREDAESLMEASGDEQLRGREASAIRGLQLGQDIGRIYAGASGAGVDVESATVKHLEKGMRSEGYRDMRTIAANAARNSNVYLDQAVSARKNAIWADYDARVQDINASLTKKMGRLQMIGGMMSAVGNWMGQSAGNWS